MPLSITMNDVCPQFQHFWRTFRYSTFHKQGETRITVWHISQWSKYLQQRFTANHWCLTLPLCCMRECSCTLALSMNCSHIHMSSWTRDRLFLEKQY